MSELLNIPGVGYQLAIDKMWLDRNVAVPDYFEATRNLYDQPPIAWALTDESIFPPAMFLPGQFDIGRAALLNFWRRYWYKDNWYTLNAPSDGMTGKDHLKTLETYMITPDDKFVPEVCRKLTASFKMYPRVSDYLSSHIGKRKKFNWLGQRQLEADKEQFISYMGWRAAGH